MARLNAFRIQFYSFGNGIHEFDFEVDDSFFTVFEDSELEKGELDVQVIMTKSDHQLQFDIQLRGKVEVTCDRCLDQYEEEIAANYVLYGKYGDGNTEEEYDVVWIPRKEHEIDLAQYIFEYIVLSLPIKKVHPLDGEGNSACNKDMLDRLSEMVVYSDE